MIDTGMDSGHPASETLAIPLAELKLAVVNVSQDIRLLIKEQIKLREVLAAQQSLSKVSAPASTAASEPTSKPKAEMEQRPLPGFLQSSAALQSAMAQLRQIPDIGRDLKGMEQANLELTAEKTVAASGATVVDLANVEYAAARSGVAANLTGDAKQQALLDFGRDAAVNATAFGIGLKDAGEMLAVWRTSLKLDREQSRNLADATSHLGKNSLKATATDIGSVLQNSGEAGITAGIAPEQLAALAAALLNADVDKNGAGNAVNTISAALAKGAKGSAAERAAWKSLGLQPDTLTDDVPQTLATALQALQKKPATQQSALLKTLFNGDEGVRKLLEKPQEVDKAFSLITSKKPVDSQSALLKSLSSGREGVRSLMDMSGGTQTAPSPLSLQGPTHSLEPQYKGSVQRAASEAQDTTQSSGYALNASLNRLAIAVAPNAGASMDFITDKINGVAEVAEGNPKTASVLAAAAAGLSAIVALLLAKAADNFSGMVLKSAAARLPAGLGKWIADLPKAEPAAEPNDESQKGSPAKKKPAGLGSRVASTKPRTGRKGRGRAAASRGNDLTRAPEVASPSLPGSGSMPGGLMSFSGSMPGGLMSFSGSSALRPPVAAQLSGAYAKAGSLLAKRAPPLRLLSAGYELVNGVRQGDTRAMVSSGASLAGSSAGAAVGAALGTLILPGVGTAIGGWLGSMAGGAIGESLGDKLGTQVDRLGSPEQVSKELTANPATSAGAAASQPVTFNSTINITGQDLASAQALANLVVQTTMGQLGQIMPSNLLATRRDAALTDGAAT
ncbi:phage tail tape measure protein [Pseudomonas retamae]|uniref:Phage tail tape measure protein n=1 Tax=Pseudomonas retamae TaxID=702110 RepID=A0ABW7DF51_9PSED